jgi:hypothetical protein
MEKIYRFELMFLGKPQGVGFLHGLNNVGITEAEVSGLATQFDSLPCEDLDEPVSFWFTEKGVRQFGAAINRVNAELSQYGWSLAGAFLDAPAGEGPLFRTDEIVYQDELQIALPEEGVRDICLEYVEIFDVETFRMEAENETMLGFQKAINALPFECRPSALRYLAGRILEAYDGQGALCGQEFDGLMYQLWLRNAEEVEKMGYEYSDD